jgi:hypothetical protein
VAKIPVKSIAKALGKDINPPVLPASEAFNIPEGEITAWHGSPHDFPPVTEIISHKTGERVLVDKNQYPDWTKHPDIEPSDYDFAGDYALGKFDSSKIGTGEGAQAYGHGLYFAQRKGTAESYQQRLRKASINKETPQLSRTNFNNIPRNIDSYLPSKNKENFSLQSLLESNKSPYFKSGKVTNAEAYLYSFFNDLENAQASRTLANFEINARLDEYEVLKAEFQNPSPVGSAEYNKAESIASKLDFGDSEKGLDAKIKSVNKLQKAVNNIDLSKFESGKGSLMEVKIRAREEEFLDFDAILDDQEFALQLLESDRGNFEWALDAVYNEGMGFNPTGRDLLAVLSDNFDPYEVSASLNKIGIKGIKYKDAQTRFSPKGATYNYVVFDDKLVSIAKKYSISLFAAGSVSLGLMTPQQAMAEDNPIGAPLPPLGTPESANDNTSANYLKSRENAGNPELEAAKARVAAQSAKEAPVQKSTAVSVAKDVGLGILEAPKQIVAGFFDATAEAAELLESIFPLEGGQATTTRLSDPKTVTGGLVRGISQFLTGFLPALKGAKALGVGAKVAPYAAGFIADATVFDPHEARLSDLIQEFPALQNPVTKYLQADLADSEIEGRFKSGIEGLGLGGLTDGLIKAVKVIKHSRSIKTAAEQQGVSVEEFIGPMQPNETGLAPKIKVAEEEFIPFSKLADDSSVEIPGPVKMGAGTAPDEAAKNINLNRLETTDDIKNLIEDFAETNPLEVNNARRQIITHKETEALADDLGMTVEDLLNRRAGVAFNAEEATAARNILVASAENLVRLSKDAATGGDMALALARRAASIHEAIMLQVSGIAAESARALNSFNIKARNGKEQMRAIKEALEATGGLELNQALFQKISEITDPAHLNRFIKHANKATTMEMIEEYWINALLSHPATHAMNITSNASVVVMSVLERKIAGIWSKDIGWQEADAMILGIIEGAKDGFKLAKKSFMTGEASDPLTKIESAQRRAISAKNLNATGVTGQAIDFLGNAIRIPGRSLMASDEFFKAVNSRMELHALAYREALMENLSPEDFLRKVGEIVNNPSPEMNRQLVDFARVQTFTNELGPIGRRGIQLRNETGIVGRLAVPFLRTPINVVKYAMARTPLAPFMPSVKADFDAGGARRDLVLSRMALGSTMMLVANQMSQRGLITGEGPVNYKERQMLELSGWKPNSIKIGDKYISLERADPIAAILLMSANVTEIFGQVDEASRADLAIASSVAVANTLTSRIYFNSLMEFFDAYQDASKDPENKQNAVNRWLKKMASTAIPAGVAGVARVTDPTVRLAFTLTEKMKSRLPGYSKDLPPRRNIFGDPIVLEGGLGPDIMSPFYMSTKKQNPIFDQIVENRVDIGMPSKTINGIDLSAVEYDRFVQLSAGFEMPVSLETALKITISRPRYKMLTGGVRGGKAMDIETVIRDYRQVATKQLLQEFPRLNSKVISAKIKRKTEETGQEFSEREKALMGVLPESE